MKIILLGASGYIGSAFRDEIFDRQIDFVCPHRHEYQSFASARMLIREHIPDLVINCAAFVTKPSVDFCEHHKIRTLAVNLVLPVEISNACEAYDVPLLHVSTGCLYNGNHRGDGFAEDIYPDLTLDNGCGFYVGSKQMAEECITYRRTYKCRIRLPFDQFDGERNYLSKIQRYPKVYSNTNSISHRGDFVNACLDLAIARAPYGTYNMTNEGTITAREIADMMKQTICKGREFEFWDEEEFMKTAALTKKSNCVLDISKLLATGVKMRHVRDAVQHSLENWTPE